MQVVYARVVVAENAQASAKAVTDNDKDNRVGRNDMQVKNKTTSLTSVDPIVMPCPFCGGCEATITHCEEDCCGAKPRWIECPCGCELGGLWNTDEDAVKQWEDRPDIYPVFDILPRLWASGHVTKEQDGEWWLFRDDGEGLISGKDFRGLCVNIVLAGI